MNELVYMNELSYDVVLVCAGIVIGWLITIIYFSFKRIGNKHNKIKKDNNNE